MSPLTPNQLAALDRAVVLLDPDKQYVDLDTRTKVVRYSNDIIQHEHIGQYTGDEEPIRAYMVAWLCTEGGYSPQAIELEKRYNFGRGSHAELDIRVRREDRPAEAYALIELKAPSDWRGVDDPRIEGQLFAPAGSESAPDVLILATIDVGADSGTFIRCVAIAYTSDLTYESWIEQGRQHVQDVPVNYDRPLPEAIVNRVGRGLRQDVTLTELDRIRRQLHNRLWGGSRDDNQIYHWLVKLLLAKIHDEKTTNEDEPYAFQVLHRGSIPESAAETLGRVDRTYLEAYQRYISPTTDDTESIANGPFSAAETQWVVKMLQGISIASAGRASGDLLGSFFENITRDGFKQSKGLFFTHYNIAIFMLEALSVTDLAETKLQQSIHPNDRLPYILDPSCGSGTFLLAAMRLITSHIEVKRPTLARNSETREQLALRFPPDAPNAWAKDFIYGIEKREDLAMSTKVNMVLHRDGHSRIYHDDGLAPLDKIAARHAAERMRGLDDIDGIYDKKVSEAFDVIVTNPPFSIELDSSIQATLPRHFQLAGEKNSENLFLERWYQLLKPNGRLGAVMPESFFSTAENQSARVFLLLHFNVRAVVTLPPHAFQPWTPTRTSLLFAQKRPAEEEARWVEAYDRASKTIRDILVAARNAARRLQNPPRTYTDERSTADTESVDAFLNAAVLRLLSERGSAAWAEEALRLIAAFNSSSYAMRVTMDELEGDSYLGMIVDEIGYKRTKRAENTRRNDLFLATRVDATGAQQAIRNLNNAPDDWRLVTSESGEDALSIIKGANLWA